MGTANLGAFLEREKSEANPKCTDNQTSRSLISQVTQEPMKTVSPHLPLTPGTTAVYTTAIPKNNALAIEWHLMPRSGQKVKFWRYAISVVFTNIIQLRAVTAVPPAGVLGAWGALGRPRKGCRNVGRERLRRSCSCGWTGESHLGPSCAWLVMHTIMIEQITGGMLHHDLIGGTL